MRNQPIKKWQFTFGNNLRVRITHLLILRNMIRFRFLNKKILKLIYRKNMIKKFNVSIKEAR